MPRRVLIVEDDITFSLILQTWFTKNGFETTTFTKIEQAKQELLKKQTDLILSDLRLPDGDGIMLLSWLNEQKISTPVFIMTSYAEIQSAVAAIKLGAVDFLEKPINPTVLKQKIGQLWEEQDTQRVRTPAKKEERDSRIVLGKSPGANEMYHHIQLVAPTRMTVLILGESGTGKEYAARMIHEQSERKNKTFIAVDCGSLSKELAPSELFGHIKGSFTSAIADKKGVFEQADGGTVFLDEVGNLSYEVQIQLLRTLQEQKIRPVGSAKDLKIDIRILAATNENLEHAIRDGKFREDLYHRLNEFSITVPPLRERKEDIEIFSTHFLEEANRELDKQVKRISEKALKVLQNHYWSGNLRELRNAIRRAVLFAQTDELNPEHLPPLTAPLSDNKEETIPSLRTENERELIEAALKKTAGNKSLAARLLKIDRKTLYNKMHLYGMEL